MIGVFDSGRGGERVAKRLHSLMPSEDLLLLCDRENAPFGTKSEKELKAILKTGIERLVDGGARRVIIGCCTMCTVLHTLPREYSDLCREIITPTAKSAALQTKNRSIALLATERTVKSRAFERALTDINSKIKITPIQAQELVGIAEKGGISTKEEEGQLNALLDRVALSDADTLILGCTHFGELLPSVRARLSSICIVDSAHEGAMSLSLTENEKKEAGKIIKL